MSVGKFNHIHVVEITQNKIMSVGKLMSIGKVMLVVKLIIVGCGACCGASTPVGSLEFLGIPRL